MALSLTRLLLALVTLAFSSGTVSAASYQIVGKKLQIVNKGTEDDRKVNVIAKEKATDIPPFPNPAAGYALLDIVVYAVSGGTPSEAQYSLDPAGWKPIGTTGFKYTPPSGNPDPVKQVILKRTPSGNALVKVQLRGNVGSTSMDVVPPNSGSGGSIVLTISTMSTDSYCINFGGAAGGAVKSNDAESFKLVCPKSSPCVETACPCSMHGAPTCGAGHCPSGEECLSFNSAVSGISTPECGCFTTGSSACGSTAFPTCGDVCPATQTCLPYTDPFEGDTCSCVSPSAPACTFSFFPFPSCFGSCSVGSQCGALDTISGECGCIAPPDVPCGESSAPTCGGACLGGETCVPAQNPFLGSTCSCSPPGAACCSGGYECTPGRTCTYDIMGSCSGCTPITPPPSCSTVLAVCGSCPSLDGLCLPHSGGPPANACYSFGTCISAACSSDLDCTGTQYCAGGAFCCDACP